MKVRFISKLVFPAIAFVFALTFTNGIQAQRLNLEKIVEIIEKFADNRFFPPTDENRNKSPGVKL